MSLGNTITLDNVWASICKHEGQTFLTVARKQPYTYVIKNDCILINGDAKKSVSKEALEKALSIENPTRSKIEEEGIWGPSYVYGIITDKRILSAC